MTSFDEQLARHGKKLIKADLDILQVNLGKLCNLTCVHCHVDAGPTKTRENMSNDTAQAVIRAMEKLQPSTLDLTGGAPEMNAHFRELVRMARRLNIHVIDRCNLSVLFEPGLEDLACFLKEHRVEIVASLPCYTSENVDKQRGRGTFHDSIRALQKLNELGYARDPQLVLNLVYNPVGPHLPPSQVSLESDYKKRLLDDFGIVFNRLFTITNMPVTRYAKYLKATGDLEAYEKLLFESFNPATVDDLMCVNTLNVGWDGKLYDCDFNQMLDLRMTVEGKVLTIFDVDESFQGRLIDTGKHCFGCTAGAGSSCGGELVSHEN